MFFEVQLFFPTALVAMIHKIHGSDVATSFIQLYFDVKMSTRRRVLARDEKAGKERGRTRRMWVEIEILWARKHLSEYHRLVRELRLDGAWFKEYFRMSRTQFDILCGRIGPTIARRDTSYREAISL